MKKISLLFILFFVTIFNTNPIFRTLEAGRYYYWLYSPDLLGRGMGYNGSQNPSGIIINPASNAFIQRYMIEFSGGFTPAFWAELNTIFYDKNSTYYNEKFLNAGDFFLPFIVNAGFVIPSRYGNFTVYLDYQNMSNQSFGVGSNNDLGIGKTGSVYFAFSKDYDDRFAFGVSGNLKFSYNPLSKYPNNRFDVAGGFDFGFIFRPEWRVRFSKKFVNWGFQDFEFSIVLKDIAKPLINTPDGPSGDNDIYWFPPSFTVATGMSFNWYNDGATYWKWLLDLSFPFFQNLNFAFGMELQIYKLIVLKASYTFDLEGVLEYAGIIPLYEYRYTPLNGLSFGMSIKFRSDFFKKQTKDEEYKNRHKTNEFSIDLAAKPFHNGFIFEAGCTITIGLKDTTPPDITYTQKDYYISPNFDGVQDELVIDLDIRDDRYVMYWKLEIYDQDGKIVRTIESKEERKETLKFKDFVKRYFAPKSGILIPKQVVWDGKDNSGNVVKDGKYTFKFFAMDDNKNINKDGSREGVIVVKTDKPQIDSKFEYTIFSPNNDGNKDTLIIDIDIIKQKIETVEIDLSNIYDFETYEIKKPECTILIKELNSIKNKTDLTSDLTNKKQIWYVDILDSNDNVVKRYSYTEKGKQKIEWDGKDEKGNQMPDGVYKVKLHSTDLAGNYWENIITNIIINTEPTPIEAIVLNRYFSPNNDNVLDKVKFKFNIPNKNGIEKWNLDIIDEKNNIITTYKGEGLPPENIEWDGKEDKSNKIAKEGVYKAKLTVQYINGNRPIALTPDFILDITPPNANIKFSYDIFSPDGDGEKDEMTISQNTSNEEEWIGTIYDQQGNKVKSFIWKGEPPKQFNWDGRDNSNKLLKDGTYIYQLTSTDRAGNKFESQKYNVKIFTENTPVFITASLESFSPNNDKIKDSQIFQIRANIAKDNPVVEWNINIYDDKDSLVYSANNKGSLPENFEWNGKDTKGNTAKDGDYYAVLNAKFNSGTSSKSKTRLFSIDTIPPQIELKIVIDVFSPNGDNNLDNFEILQKGSNEDLWEGVVKDPNGKDIVKVYYNGKPEDKFIWNGKDMNGNIQKNGIYSYTITATDKAGNSGSAKIDKIELKNVYTSVFVTLDKDKFSPNKDGAFDTIKIKPFLSVVEDVEVYKLEILDKDKKVVKTFEGTKKVPEIIEWDGLNDNMKISSDGIYTAKLSVIYRFGNNPSIESAQFILDNTPPEFDVSYNPDIFSPDNDGVDDELTLNIKSNDLSGIKDWKIIIMNPARTRPFVEFVGNGKPTERIVWNGKGKSGDLVESAEDYPVVIYAIDEVGNKLEKEINPVMVDILIEKLSDGRLKIRISNIEFKPDSAEMTDSPKNQKILDLLAKALKKYGQYKITIEGHANRFFVLKYNEEIAKNLSKRRADTVLNLLVKRGIAARRMTTIGVGGDRPVFEPKDEKGMAKEEIEEQRENLGKNRRVEFYLQKE
ncbi:MAG TPA: FlgD immunoglobulin-like domain containing protein [Spirochaetota bacterium]|nr:FlgD immunoglobulin-like domain containing protein [Spirochaetota bacterium]HOL58003.1 FlgD immunoglobulin-like domain containing protein [Spirochaetota bacterium]HPP03528.1 FlgD immunoglobulin-like domain containing protein [Spirochaetota bacterium]